MAKGTLQMANAIVFGTNAEILSVLRDSSFWSAKIPGGDWNRIAQILDTRTPPEERAPAAVSFLREIQNLDAVARWIPRFDQLPEAEFRQNFYSGYRDHSIHTLQAWLLGIYLFETVAVLREPLLRALSARSAIDSDGSSLFYRWWTLAVMWHDTGYPFESEGMSSDAAIRTARLNTLAENLSADAYRAGLRLIGCAPTDALLREIHRAGRHAPIVIETIEQIIDDWDEERTLNTFWRRIGLPQTGAATACRVLDDLTVRAAVKRSAFHDHGLFSSLLLLKCAQESRAFVDETISALGTSSFRGLLNKLPREFMNRIQEIQASFYESDELIKAAAEAISFHNYNFKLLDPTITKSVLGTNERPTVSLGSEPHVVFLALVDELQDWDRHHFFPQTAPETRYRPAVRSDQMLLQGVNGAIRVTLDNSTDSTKQVRKLFEGRVTGLESLFEEGARFTRPSEVQAVTGPSITLVETSNSRLKNIIQDVIRASESARTALSSDDELAVVNASDHIEPTLHRIAREKGLLQASDQIELENFLNTCLLRRVEELVLTHIRPGKLLSLGRVVEKLGEGGFGRVWHIEQSDRGGTRSIAFKIFHGHDLGDSDKRGCFERGYTAMHYLRGVPRVVKVDKFSSFPYGLSMEYIAGANLEANVRDVGDVHARLNLLKIIAETLATSHQRGILHRDIKPTNVLLDSARNNEPILTDYDLACYIGNKATTLANAQFANQIYGAPEQFDEKLRSWRRKPSVDVYGFGRMAYFVLTSRDPPILPSDDEQWGVLEDALRGHLAAVVVKRVVDLLQQMTVRDPKERFSEVDELRQFEAVVLRLSEIINMNQSVQEGRLSQDAWLREVVYTFTGHAPDHEQRDFGSPAGGTTWNFEFKHSRTAPVFQARCRLNREPRHEGVNFAGYTRKSSQQVDRALAELGKIGRQDCAKRHGELGSAGSEIRIEILVNALTLIRARAVGETLKAVSRAIE